MGKYIIEDTTLDKIASAVRSRSGKTDKWSVPNGLVSAIMSIPTQTNVVQNITGEMKYTMVVNSTTGNQVDLSPYIKNSNFTLAFTIYNGSQWVKRAIAPSLVTTDPTRVYSYITTASDLGMDTLQSYWGAGKSNEDYGLQLSNGILTCNSKYKFGKRFALIYVG